MIRHAILFRDLPPAGSDEAVQPLAFGNAVRVERIVSHGHASPPGFWYDQPHAEWVALLAGAATIRFEQNDERVELQPGDHLEIPAHRRHRVEWTTPEAATVWLAVHYSEAGPL